MVFDKGAKIRFIDAEEVEPLVPVDLGNFGMGFKVFEQKYFLFRVLIGLRRYCQEGKDTIWPLAVFYGL